MFCSLVRWRLAAALDRADGSTPGGAHLARCVGCRKFAADLESLHARLTAGAHAAPRPTLSAPRRRLVARSAVALVMAGAAALLMLTWPGGSQVPVEQPSEPAIAAPTVEEPRTSRPTREVVGRLGQLFAEPAPLRAELNALAADGRRGAFAILDLGGVSRWAERVR